MTFSEVIVLSNRILIGSPICQKPTILDLFLRSLTRLCSQSIELHYLFIDDNKDPESSTLLTAFKNLHPDQTTILSIPTDDDEHYLCDHTTHHWNDKLIWKVASFKNRIMAYALDHEFDALFLLDSDLLLQPPTLEKLIEAHQPIVSEIFWTRWQPDSTPMPQVWLSDEYSMYENRGGRYLSDRQKATQQLLFLLKLLRPGVYEVGGLGACTLIRREALNKGLSFDRIKSLSFWGEDRHFCIRAHVLGIPLHVDTHYPAYHIYRETDLPDAAIWLEHTESHTQDASAIKSSPPNIR